MWLCVSVKVCTIQNKTHGNKLILGKERGNKTIGRVDLRTQFPNTVVTKYNSEVFGQLA